MKVLEIPLFVMSLLGFGLLSSVDAPPAHAGFTFGEPVNLKSVIPVIDPDYEGIGCFSSDGLEIYYIDCSRAGGQGGSDLWVLKRDSIDEPWGLPVNLGPLVNSPNADAMPSISDDGLTLYFNSNRPGGYGSFDIYMTTRATKNDSWGQAVNVGSPINTSSVDGEPWISPDNVELHFISYRAGGYGRADIWVTKRATMKDPWGDPVNLGSIVNSPHEEQLFSLSPDGRLLLFGDTYAYDLSGTPRPGGYGGGDVWMARRAAISDTWQTPVNLGPMVNGPACEWGPRISIDGRMLHFVTIRNGTYDNWQAPILPVVDFNGDGQVDGKELLAMIVEFGGTDALCDIAPYAWGDGVVDFEDFKVLAEYFGPVTDPTLIAHWPLDESDGMTAHDMVGENDATVMGGALWQPEGGRIAGALQFDGVSSFAVVGTVPGLQDGPFSILAWIKGGAPDQVILSQQQGEDWLYTNPADGSLMTRLMGSGRTTEPGFSDVVVTDGQWHRIGLIWDGADRILHVDGEEVARDAQSTLTIPDQGLLIGGGGAMTPGTFFSGQIDEIRIYNRAVKP